MEKNKRLKILSKSEISDVYRLPILTPDQRVLYFTLDDLERQEMQSRYRIGSRIDFILQLGYFKYRPIFFKFNIKDAAEDIHFIANKYFPKATIPKVRVSPKTQWKNQSDILKLLKFKMFDQTTQQMLADVAQKMIAVYSNARYIFDGLLQLLDTHKRTLPGYTTLQKIIGKAFLMEEKRLAQIIEDDIPQDVDKAFRQLLESEESIYGITIFKTDAKGFKNADIKAEIDKKTSSESLYNFAAKTLPKLKISRDNILYYASLVDYYSVDKLRELSYDNARLYLLCYSFYRFQKTTDNLVNAFVYYVNSYQKKAKEVGKQEVYEYKSSRSDYFEQTLELLELFVDKSIKGMTLFEKVREKAFGIVKEEEFPALKQGLKGHVIDERKFAWEHYPKIAGLITRNLRPLARTINFEGDKPNDDLIIALEFLKKTFDTKKSLKKINQDNFPTAFIPSNRQSYLYDSDAKDPSIKTINVHKYEFLVYEQLEAELSSGRIVVNNSTSFKSFSRDLTLIKTEEQRKNLLSNLNNPLLNTPIKTQLKEYKDRLNPLLSEVNAEIASGENKAIKFKKNGTWSIPYSGQKNEINNPFYGQFSQTSLINVLHFVNKHCNFINFFPHIRPRYAKGEADEDGLYACLIAFATNHGIFKISQISDLNYNVLHSIFKNNIRLENLKNAADILSDKIAELPMFNRWNLMDNLLFASLDGKKRQTKRQNIISRFSPKYFGRKRGVVCYSMIANNVCVNAKILGANEHESHYSFDMVHNQNTNITADYICGDDHSINSVNFVLFRLISSKFAPHLKSLYKKAQKLFCFGSPEKYQGNLLIPEGTINSKLIEEEWENIQHIFASLLMKETTQSIVVKKLSSYKRRNKTQAALWEFDKIFRSLHILHFIQDPVFRQCIRISLNRGEGIHQLTGALGDIGGGKFKGSTELELQIANECLRLVTNCIIYYNTAILSKIYETQEKAGNTQALEFLTRLSPIAWCHINLGGNYEFINQENPLNIDEMIANLDFDVVMK